MNEQTKKKEVLSGEKDVAIYNNGHVGRAIYENDHTGSRQATVEA